MHTDDEVNRYERQIQISENIYHYFKIFCIEFKYRIGSRPMVKAKKNTVL